MVWYRLPMMFLRGEGQDIICAQIDKDFGEYILPKLSMVKSYEDFTNLRVKKLKQHEEKEIRLLKFYYAVQFEAVRQSAMLNQKDACSLIVKNRKELELSCDDIVSHLEWLDICRKNSPFTKIDVKELVVRASKEGQS